MRMPIGEFSSYCHRVAGRLKTEIRSAEETTLSSAKEVAESLSHGPLKTRDLRKMGHPYAKRAPNPPFDDAIVNEQTRRFAEGFETIPTIDTWNAMTSTLANNSPEAVFLSGTKWMIRRPLLARTLELTRVERSRRVTIALSRAFRG